MYNAAFLGNRKNPNFYIPQAGKFPKPIKPATGKICNHALYLLQPNRRDNPKTPGQMADELIAKRRPLRKDRDPAPCPTNLENQANGEGAETEVTSHGHADGTRSFSATPK